MKKIQTKQNDLEFFLSDIWKLKRSPFYVIYFHSDVEKFLLETLKNENLSSSTNKSRNLLLEKLNNLKQEYPQLQLDIPPVGTSPKSVPKSSE